MIDIDITSKLQTQNFNIDSSLMTRHSSLKEDPKVMAKQIETLFLNEFLKIMFEQTSFGQDRTVSTYLPLITSQIAESLSESGRGIGIGEFLSRAVEQKGNRAEEIDFSSLQHGRGESINSAFSPQFESPLLFRLPVEGKITSGFGLRRDPIDGTLRHHRGIDIAVPEGSSIRAAAPGRVVFSGFSAGYGNTVIIEHDNGLSTLYAHNASNLVKAGDVVDKNSIIALAGSTGRSTGSHLHFEVRKNGTPVDPIGMMVRNEGHFSGSG
jgi:murein DD-endopeptidase MepM/ murein hydrolase activator NlpD